MTNADRPSMRIAVFGEAHALWPVAAALSANLPPHASLTLVEQPDGDNAPGALTLPCNSAFHRHLDVDVRALARTTGARFGLGVDLQGWQGEGSSFFAAPSGTLPKINDIELHHIMLRAAMERGEPESLAYLLRPFRFAARAAMAGKFAFPPDDPESPLQLLGPTIQVDRARYGEFFETFVNDAERLRSTPASVDCGPEGAISTVTLESGDAIAADLYIDASGTLSALMPRDGRPESSPLNEFPPFDRIARAFIEGGAGADHRCTIAKALTGGVLVETPVGGGLVREYWHGSGAHDAETLAETMGAPFDTAPFASTHYATPWTGNCVRLGSASARLGPFHSADAILLQEQALDLAALLPAGPEMTVEARTFNAKHHQIVRQLRDFVLLPFTVNGRDEAVWKTIADAPPPDTLQLRLEQFRSRGRFVTFDREMFDRQTWIDLMIGFGIVPERYDRLAGALDMKRLPPVLKQMIDAFSRTIDAMPSAKDAAS